MSNLIGAVPERRVAGKEGAGAPSAADAGRFDAFMSYARADADASQRLRAALGERDHAVWIDVEGIVAGADWQARIERAIEACTAFVFLISPRSVDSTICLQELSQAAALNKLIIPVVIAPTDGLPRVLTGYEQISASGGDFEAAVGALSASLSADWEWRDQHTRLAGRTREWRDARRNRSYLLRGSDLDDAERWLGGQRDHLQAPTTEQAAYVVASRRAASARQRTLLGGAVGAVLLTLALATFALVQREAADHDRRVALSKGLAAQALALSGGDPTLAAALSLEADRIQPTAEAGGAIDGALARLQPSLGALSGHSTFITRVVVSPDGRKVASSDERGSVRLWDIATRSQIGKPLTARTGNVGGVAFSPDGRTLATAGYDKTVRMWDVATRRQLGKPLTGHTRGVARVAFSPDGRLIASAGLDKTVRLWDVATRRPARPAAVGRAGEPIMAVAFSPDGKLLATSGFAGLLQLRDSATNLPVGRPFGNHRGFVHDVGFSPDGATLATAGADGTVRLWSVANQRQLGAPMIAREGQVLDVAFAPDGRTLASTSIHGARLWSVATHKPIGSYLGTDALTVAFAPDGRMLVSAGIGAIVTLWNVVSQPAAAAPVAVTIARLPTKFIINTAATLALPHGAAFSPDSRTLASARGGSLQLLTIATRSTSAPSRGGHRGPVLDVAFSPDGATVVTAGADGTARLWDAPTRRPLGSPLRGHRGPVNGATFSPDGATLATASDDGSVRLWGAATRRPLGPALVFARDGRVMSVAFSPDGTLLAGGGIDGRVRLWSVATRRPLGRPLTGHSSSVAAVAFSPDGATLASGSSDGTVRLWDVAARRLRGAPLSGHTAQISDVAFSPDGATLASGSSLDNSIRLWDVATRNAVGAPLVTPAGGADAVAFSPDGRILASVDPGSSKVWLWDAILWSRSPRARRDRVCVSARRNLTRAEWRRYLPGEPYRTTCPRP